jgi:DNA end-binding protein Ku
MPPARATFTGYVQLSLVAIPVRAFTASESSAEIRLNQLHDDCGNRIRYVKTCPVHGEVSNDEIVKGYEYQKGQYALVEPDEVAAIRKQSEKAIPIQGFVAAGELDPIYYAGRTYYLLPDGPVGQKAYSLLLRSMKDENLIAIASVVTAGRQHMVAIRPIGDVLGMSVLQYADTIKAVDEFEEELGDVTVSPEEVALTQTLISASTLKDFDLAKYKDDYTDQLNRLIQMKIEGQEIVAAPEEEEPKVINLMEALKASVENAKARQSTAAAEDETAAKRAPSAKSRTERKKKTG